MKTIVIGSGSWGSALAQVLCDNDENVIIYGKNKAEVDDINLNHRNTAFFNDLLNPKLKATCNIDDIKDGDIYLLSVPTVAIEEVCLLVKKIATKPFIIVNTAKGFHPISFKRMSEVISDVFDNFTQLQAIVSLIGPSHAEEVVKRMLTTINAVSTDEKAAKTIQQLFSNRYLRIYTNTDVIGSEIGVAVKNAIALASGVLVGLQYGDNTKAALITRGLAEMTRYGVKCGGNLETYLGLCGLGDLIVTCTSIHSRNFQAGLQIGKANDASLFLKKNTKTVEGINTAKAVYLHSKELGIDMPIVTQIYRVIYENEKPSECIELLMNRRLVSETY